MDLLADAGRGQLRAAFRLGVRAVQALLSFGLARALALRLSAAADSQPAVDEESVVAGDVRRHASLSTQPLSHLDGGR